MNAWNELEALTFSRPVLFQLHKNDFDSQTATIQTHRIAVFRKVAQEEKADLQTPFTSEGILWEDNDST